MIQETVKLFVESIGTAFVASTDENGVPHLAAGHDPTVSDPDHLVFEAWFCPRTLQNVSRNPRVAVAVVTPDSGAGYQFVGTVEDLATTGILDGFTDAQEEPPGMPQVQSRLLVRVDEVMEFSEGAHTDRPFAVRS